MIMGLRTAIYAAPDLAQGKEWYRNVLGQEPYFDEPYYVGFSVGGFELGLVPDSEPGTQGAQIYWGVEDAQNELNRLIDLGAELYEALTDVGGGVRVAGVLDPFGNAFRIIENPHFQSSQVR